MAQASENLRSCQGSIVFIAKSFYGKKRVLDVPFPKICNRNLVNTIDITHKRKKIKKVMSKTVGREKKRIKRETCENKIVLKKTVPVLDKEKLANNKFFNSGRSTNKTFTVFPGMSISLNTLTSNKDTPKANSISIMKEISNEISGDILGKLLLTKPNIRKEKSVVEEDNNIESSRKRLKLSFLKNDNSQMIIDAGQKNVESVICHRCGMLYLPNSLEDAALHYKFHNQRSDTVPFSGWKTERVVREFEDGRIILVLSNDAKFALKKVEEVQNVMDSSLGIHDQLKKNNSIQTFLFVSNKEIIGCVMAEAISKAYLVVERKTIKEPLCCSTISQRAVCGINRIWTATAFRRKKIASRLMDCVKSAFYYGCVVPDDQIAFSDPSPIGQKFASSYLKTEAYLVYQTN